MTATTTAATDLTGSQAALLAQNAKTAHTVEAAAAGKPSVLEPKLDGWRALAHVGTDGVHLYSRSGKNYDGRLPEVEAELAARFPAGTWLDGEVVALGVDADGHVQNEWGLAQSVMTTHGEHPRRDEVTFMVFDLLAHGGIDARTLPLAKRRVLLERVFAQATFHRVALITQHTADEATHQRMLEVGFEGSVVKHVDAPYASGKRGRGWFKLKPQTTIDAVVMGYKPGENGFEGMVGAIVFGQHDADGVLVERGRCSGMDLATRKAISADPDGYLGRVFEVAHHGKMSDGLRHPQFRRFRPDRDPKTVTLHDE